MTNQTGPSPLHELLTIKEAADYLRVDKRTVRVWARKKGFFPSLRLGTRDLRIKRADLETFLEGAAEDTRPPQGTGNPAAHCERREDQTHGPS